MNTFKMSSDTLFNLACDVIDSLEETLSASIMLTDQEIYAQLEESLGYSLSHIRDIFKLSTNISLTKYISRRKYTNILIQMPQKNFDELTMHAKVFGIQKFKSKCLREFPLLVDRYSLKNMQPPIDQSLLRELINIQIEKKGEVHLMKSLYKDIIKGRTPFEIKDHSQNIFIQTPNDILVDLEKTYFIFEDVAFKITATVNIMQRQTKDPLLSMLFGQPVYPSYNLPADANSVIHTLHHFLISNTPTTNGFSIIVEWGSTHGWGISKLISSMSFSDIGNLKDVKFVDNPFLLFDNQKVILNLSFLHNACPE